MSRHLLPIHTVNQVRAIDRDAIERLGIPGYTLMTRAGAAALRVLRKRWPKAKRIAIVCGAGNNGGDGYVVARLARREGCEVTVTALCDPQLLKGDAHVAWQEFASEGGQAVPWSNEILAGTDVIVDAIFGTGLSRPLDAIQCAQVEVLNKSEAPILALDIPSGLHADTGAVLGAAVKADCTITFVGLKLGLYLGSAPDYVGALEFEALDIPANHREIGVAAELITNDWLRTVLPRRARLSHKGTNGHALLIGGGIGMGGAIRLTGEACLRVGAGLVTVATHPQNVASVVSERAELIVRAIDSANDLRPLIEDCDVIAIGPGLSQTEWARSVFTMTLESDKPMVVDADALNLLAIDSIRKSNWILTPHPGEAARLAQSSNGAIQQDRLRAVREIQSKFGGTVVLKGANTIVLGEDSLPAICDRGNPGMGTAGMGDVLTGVICGLLAQLKNTSIAARAGVFVHATAADRAADALGPGVERGLIASDLFVQLPACVNFDE